MDDEGAAEADSRQAEASVTLSAVAYPVSRSIADALRPVRRFCPKPIVSKAHYSHLRAGNVEPGVETRDRRLD